MPPPPISTLFPYTTLFRSDGSSKWQWQPLSYPYQAERQDDAAFLRGPNQYNRASRRGSLAADSGRNSKAGSRKVGWEDRKSTRLNSSHVAISYAVFCLKKK